MLIPAIIKKEEITEAFQHYFYTDEMMYVTGALYNWIPDISTDAGDGVVQYAIVNPQKKLIGYLSYEIDWYSSCAHKFGLISFNKGNPLVGADLFAELTKLIHEYKLHRIEWQMLSGNPVEKKYDKFCEKYNGIKHIFRDTMKDKQGNYHDSIVYEIIN